MTTMSRMPLRHRHFRQRRRRRLRLAERDRGQISVLIIGLFGVCLMLIIGGVDVTATQIARTRLLDAADAAALDAANALDEQAAYSGGLGPSVRVSTTTVQEAAARNIATRPRPVDIASWQTGAGTGSPDGRTAVVILQGETTLPFTGGILSALGGSVTITVEGRARADLR